MNFDDLLPDTVFAGNPDEQFHGILRVCDPHAARNEIDALIDRMAKLEAFLQEKGLLDEAEAYRPDSDETTKLRRNYLIGAMARVVSAHER